MNPRFAFFGTGPIAKIVLEELLAASLTPALVVTAPDQPQGRGLALAPSPVASVAAEHALPIQKPAKLTPEFIATLAADAWDCFVVADYGFILPKALLDIPRHGTLNMHPSLLPRLRGPSPIRSAILTDEKATGVTIMLIDEQMDHGPILVQESVLVPEWPPRARVLEELLAHAGGKLLAETIPRYLSGEIIPHEQEHERATYTKKLTKEDGELDLTADPQMNLRKIRALEGWPGTYAFFERSGKRLRVKILDAHLENDRLVIETVVPEGRGAMPYEAFLRSGAKLII